MQTHVECFPCIMNQTLEAAEHHHLPEDVKERVVFAVLDMLRNLPDDISPPLVSTRMHEIIGETIGQQDPYADIRRNSNVLGLDLIPEIRKKIANHRSSLATAIRYAIAAQVFDGENGRSRSDIHRELEYAPSAEFGVDHIKSMKRDLRQAEKIVYLANAAGEIAFDRLLIEQIIDHYPAEIVLVVKQDPVLLYATLEDAEFVGLDSLTHLVANRSDAPATVLEKTSEKVKKHIDDADVILAKGQIHYESLSEVERNIYFLFQVNCPVISREIGAEIHQYIIMQGSGA